MSTVCFLATSIATTRIYKTPFGWNKEKKKKETQSSSITRQQKQHVICTNKRNIIHSKNSVKSLSTSRQGRGKKKATRYSQTNTKKCRLFFIIPNLLLQSRHLCGPLVKDNHNTKTK